MNAENALLCGDVLTTLATLPDDSFDCIVTSPPYWGLRDYGIAGQLGLEKTFDEYLLKLTAIFDQLRRVLKPTGTAWVNMGDCYAGSGNGRMGDGTHADNSGDKQATSRGTTTGIISKCEWGMKPKDLVGQPWRLAFALRDSGWYLRQDIIWHKPAPMPESVTDRCTKAHEYLFLLSKRPRYYYNAAAIRTAALTDDLRTPYGSKGAWEMDGRPEEQRHGGKIRKCFRVPEGWAVGAEEHSAIAHSRRERSAAAQPRSATKPLEHIVNAPMDGLTRDEMTANGANARSVWTIASKGYKGAHFAVFPLELAARCIRAGCPPDGRVLDPFGGSGTTAEAAAKLGRAFTLIDLNPAYVKLQRQRLGLFAPAL